jgi:pyruvate dehydrogenase E2 component (dihydrolipoamide acetyltransferase)
MVDARILMPKLGLTMTEGLISAWSVKVGDAVKAGDILFVVETDKIANEVEAAAEGVITALLVAEGETVPVGTPVASWTGHSADADCVPPDVAPTGSTSQPTVTAAGLPYEMPPKVLESNGRLLATPLARRMAKHAAIDLSGLTGSGPRGRIKAADVTGAIISAKALPPASTPIPTAPPATGLHGETVRPLSPIERVVAKRLTEAKQSIPHFYVFSDADVTALLKLRKELNTSGSRVKISVNHCITAAIAKSLAKMPEMNAVWRDGQIISRESIDIGIAVDTPRGLMVPVLRGLNDTTLPIIAGRADELVARARDGKLGGADLEGGAISLSNIGMYGASFLVPIINPGQSAILGVGAPKKVFRPDQEDKPVLCEELGLVLSCDHRLFDGVRAAVLLDHIRQALENPLRLLMP